MACTEPRLTALKVGYKGEIHRIRVDLSVFHLEDLTNLFSQTFALAPGSFVVQYKDAEGDCLNVCSGAEYVEACRVFLTGADAVKALRFVAVSRTQVAFQENVADPILKAIEKLVEMLNAAMEKVKREEWAQRVQTNVEHTNEVVMSAAKTAAHDARESFQAARQSIQELPFEQVLKETTDGIKTAAEGISAFAQDLVVEIRNMAQPPVVAGSGEVVMEEEIVQPEATVEEEVAVVVEPVQAADSEWEQVTEVVATPVAPVEEAPVFVAEAVVSEGEQKWTEHLTMIRDIFPTADTARVIESLEQSNGNIQVVLNALMEEM